MRNNIHSQNYKNNEQSWNGEALNQNNQANLSYNNNNSSIIQNNTYNSNHTKNRSTSRKKDNNKIPNNFPQFGQPSEFLEEMYKKYSKSLQRYFIQNREGMKLSINKYFQRLSVDEFIKERKNSQKKYLEKMKNNNNNNNINENYTLEKINNSFTNNYFDEDFFLTPLPNKSRKLLNTDQEKNDFLSAERQAVIMRTFEYSYGVRSKFGINEYKKMLEDHKKQCFNIMINAANKIKKMWKIAKKNSIKKKQTFDVKYKNIEQNISDLIMKKKIFNLINKLKNYVMKENKNDKKNFFKKIQSFSKNKIKKIYYLNDWINNLKINKNIKFSILSPNKIKKIDKNFYGFLNYYFLTKNIYYENYNSNRENNKNSAQEQIKKITFLQKFIKSFVNYKKIKDFKEEMNKNIEKESFGFIKEQTNINFVNFLKENNNLKKNYSSGNGSNLSAGSIYSNDENNIYNIDNNNINNFEYNNNNMENEEFSEINNNNNNLSNKNSFKRSSSKKSNSKEKKNLEYPTVNKNDDNETEKNLKRFNTERYSNKNNNSNDNNKINVNYGSIKKLYSMNNNEKDKNLNKKENYNSIPQITNYNNQQKNLNNNKNNKKLNNNSSLSNKLKITKPIPINKDIKTNKDIYIDRHISMVSKKNINNNNLNEENNNINNKSLLEKKNTGKKNLNRNNSKSSFNVLEVNSSTQGKSTYIDSINNKDNKNLNSEKNKNISSFNNKNIDKNNNNFSVNYNKNNLSENKNKEKINDNKLQTQKINNNVLNNVQNNKESLLNNNENYIKMEKDKNINNYEEENNDSLNNDIILNEEDQINLISPKPILENNIINKENEENNFLTFDNKKINKEKNMYENNNNRNQINDKLIMNNNNNNNESNANLNEKNIKLKDNEYNVNLQEKNNQKNKNKDNINYYDNKTKTKKSLNENNLKQSIKNTNIDFNNNNNQLNIKKNELNNNNLLDSKNKNKNKFNQNNNIIPNKNLYNIEEDSNSEKNNNIPLNKQINNSKIITPKKSNKLINNINSSIQFEDSINYLSNKDNKDKNDLNSIKIESNNNKNNKDFSNNNYNSLNSNKNLYSEYSSNNSYNNKSKQILKRNKSARFSLQNQNNLPLLNSLMHQSDNNLNKLSGSIKIPNYRKSVSNSSFNINNNMKYILGINSFFNFFHRPYCANYSCYISKVRKNISSNNLKEKIIQIINIKKNKNKTNVLQNLFKYFNLWKNIYNDILKKNRFDNNNFYLSKKRKKYFYLDVKKFLVNLNENYFKIINKNKNIRLKKYYNKWKNITFQKILLKPFNINICYISKINRKYFIKDLKKNLGKVLKLKDNKNKINLTKYLLKWKDLTFNDYYNIKKPINDNYNYYISKIRKKIFSNEFEKNIIRSLNQINKINKNKKNLCLNKYFQIWKNSAFYTIFNYITKPLKLNNNNNMITKIRKKFFSNDVKKKLMKMINLKIKQRKIKINKFLNKWKELAFFIFNKPILSNNCYISKIRKLNSSKSINIKLKNYFKLKSQQEIKSNNLNLKKYFNLWKRGINIQKKLFKILQKMTLSNKKLYLSKYFNKWNDNIYDISLMSCSYTHNITSISSITDRSEHFSYYCKINKSNNENDFLTIRMCLGYKLLRRLFTRNLEHEFLKRLRKKNRRKKRAKTYFYNHKQTKVHLELLNFNVKLLYALNKIIYRKFGEQFYHRLIYTALNKNKNIEYNLDNNKMAHILQEGYKKGYFTILYNILKIRFNYIYYDTGLNFNDFIKLILNAKIIG